jgi:hypothetical protein
LVPLQRLSQTVLRQREAQLRREVDDRGQPTRRLLRVILRDVGKAVRKEGIVSLITQANR